MPIYEFMVRMFFFTDKHRKINRNYGLYAHRAGERMEKISKKMDCCNRKVVLKRS